MTDFRWSLTNPDDYALQFSEPTKQTFITERVSFYENIGSRLYSSFHFILFLPEFYEVFYFEL